MARHSHTRSRDGEGQSGSSRGRKHSVEPTLQLICLASGGGPAEDNVTGFLVRSISTHWNKNSVLAVDAGSHLASITRLLEADFPRYTDAPTAKPPARATTPKKSNGSGRAITPGRPASEAGYESSDSCCSSSVEPLTRTLEDGPFAGLPFPFESARANALHVVRDCVSTYLITHPHLDHLSAFAMNTAAFHNTSRPKRLAALPSTVNAIKTHIFNDVIWPNLTDEDGGVGFVTFQRLAEGGNVTLGEGRRRGFIEVCDGLCVKALKISHGQCMRSSAAMASQRGSDVGLSSVPLPSGGALSISSDNTSVSPTRIKRPSFSLQANSTGQVAGTMPAPSEPAPRPATNPGTAVVDSTAYFIQDDASGREILIFGDVEPDAISLHPRTSAVWNEAAPKIANGHLKAIVIECSYDDSQGDKVLFGHLAPRWLMRELNSLASSVRLSRAERRASRKRKRSHRRSGSHVTNHSDGDGHADNEPALDEMQDESHLHIIPTKKGRRGSHLEPVRAFGERAGHGDSSTSPLSKPRDDPMEAMHRDGGDIGGNISTGGTNSRQSISLGVPADTAPPLAGVTVIIMHIKDTFRDGPLVGESILAQLHEHEARLKEQDGVGLGCEFVISHAGGSYLF